jgi:hypothetical protein
MAIRSFTRGLPVALLLSAACSPRLQQGPLDIAFVQDFVDTSHRDWGAIRVKGLSSQELDSLRAARLDDERWRALFRVAVAGQEAPPMAGAYEVANDAVVFRPAFPLDPGRTYSVRFDPARLPAPRRDEIVDTTITLASHTPTTPSTRVTGLWPAAAVWPENILRFYIQFSAPMSRTSAVGRVHVEDDTGKEVPDAFLPLDVDLWNPDRTRYTVFFDPGRVKRGIRPNVEKGRALVAGRRYAIVVSPDWRDDQGRSLVAAFRHEVTAAPAEMRAIDPARWQLEPPTAGSRGAFVVRFPWPLDRALLQRTLIVGRPGTGLPVGGRIDIDADDRAWRFTPADPWSAGAHELVVLSALEDAAGNAVGRAFEIDLFQKPQGAAPPKDLKLPFVPRPQ